MNPDERTQKVVDRISECELWLNQALRDAASLGLETEVDTYLVQEMMIPSTPQLSVIVRYRIRGGGPVRA